MIAAAVAGLLLINGSAHSQSRDQNFPTAVSTNEINGSVKARDIGDSRLTSYYYLFAGTQGDIFINVVTKNFTGDIDVFTLEGLRPLTKIVIYADSSQNETGRLIYLRKSERLLLRIQGRTPNDDPAAFRIKFAGSFMAVAAEDTEAAPTLESAPPGDDSRTIVNSVGTIIAVAPKTPGKDKPSDIAVDGGKKESARNDRPIAIFGSKKNRSKPADKKSDVARESVEKKRSSESEPPISKPSQPPTAKSATKGKPANPQAKTPVTPVESKPDPLARILLIIQLKNGETFERPMNEITKFNVDKGILVVVEKNGKTTRHSILDVAKVTIE